LTKKAKAVLSINTPTLDSLKRFPFPQYYAIEHYYSTAAAAIHHDNGHCHTHKIGDCPSCCQSGIGTDFGGGCKKSPAITRMG